MIIWAETRTFLQSQPEWRHNQQSSQKVGHLINGANLFDGDYPNRIYYGGIRVQSGELKLPAIFAVRPGTREIFLARRSTVRLRNRQPQSQHSPRLKLSEALPQGFWILQMRWEVIIFCDKTYKKLSTCVGETFVRSVIFYYILFCAKSVRSIIFSILFFSASIIPLSSGHSPLQIGEGNWSRNASHNCFRYLC